MVRAKIDEKQLLGSLRRAGKALGDTTAQATIRWGVMAARELAKQTQAWGEGGKPERKQRGAIFKDALNVVIVHNRPGRPSRSTLTSPQAVVDWIDQHRKGSKMRTAELPPSQRKRCTSEALAGAVKIKMAQAGMAKGGWIGSGSDIERFQTGSGRLSVNGGFLRYAQKHKGKGLSRPARSGFSPTSELRNLSKHSASKNVLRDSQAKSAIRWGLRKTIKWYEKAASSALSKP